MLIYVLFSFCVPCFSVAPIARVFIGELDMWRWKDLTDIYSASLPCLVKSTLRQLVIHFHVNLTLAKPNFIPWLSRLFSP